MISRDNNMNFVNTRRWILWLFVLISISTVNSQELIKDNLVDNTPAFMRNHVEVNKTILEVEQLIAKNSDLPRLTRGEILSLLENITKEDEMKAKRPTAFPKPIRDQNVMVVLPMGIDMTVPTPTRNFDMTSPTPTRNFPSIPPSVSPIYETSSEFENLVTITKKAPTTFQPFYDVTSERSPLEFGLPMSIKVNGNPNFETGSNGNKYSPDIAEVLKTLGVDQQGNKLAGNLFDNIQTSSSAPPILQVSHDLEPVVPSIDPNSYAQFKPIPSIKKSNKNNNVNKEMQDFLATFGLVSNQTQSRSQKSMRNNIEKPEKQSMLSKNDVNFLKENHNEKNNNMNGLSNDMKNILANMGIIHKNNGSSGSSGEYIFNPVVQTTILDHAEEVNKVTKVLDGIRELSKDSKIESLSQEELRAQLDNITSQVLIETDKNKFEDISIESFDDTDNDTFNGKLDFKSNSAPDPLNEINNSLFIGKNEFKRQQPSDNVTTSSSSSTENITSTETTTTEISSDSESATSELSETTTSSEIKDAKLEAISTPTEDSKVEESSPSINDLADSFGGGETASEEPTAEALPSPRPNGLYFYVDWNTFLNVGSEDTKNRVNLRFAPKVGNPRLFLPVAVP